MISGKTAVYGLIGDPVDHSMSPVIQNAAFNSAGIDAVYIPFHVDGSGLKLAIQGLRALKVRGFNVMAPHKVNVLRHIDKVESLAADIGSVNTVVREDGQLCGYNTDGPGALNALEEAGASPHGKSILIFGAGGASQAIIYTLAQHASSTVLLNRTVSKARQLAAHLRKRFKANVTCASLSTKQIKSFVERADIVVNASSMGMKGKANPPIEGNWLRQGQCVLDIVYDPVQTKLLDLAGAARAISVTGLDMLVNQGACSFELWTRRKASMGEMRHAIAQKLLAMEHAESG